MPVYTTFSDFILDQVLGYQGANRLKGNAEALAVSRLRTPFGGSREHSINVNGVFDVWDYRDIELTNSVTGLNIRARVEGKTANAATTVTPKIRNVTDGSDKVTGSAISSTSFVEQILDMMPLTAGTKKYRLQGTTNNATNDVWLFGVQETYA